VDFAPYKKLKKTVTLAQIKMDPKLKEIQLVKQSRLSVAKLTAVEFDHILLLSNQS
jgi:predicted RNA-binding protein with PUA-like domain